MAGLAAFKRIIVLRCVKSAASVATKSFVGSTFVLIWDRKFLQVVLTPWTLHYGKYWKRFHTLEFGTIKRNQLDIECVLFSQHKSFLHSFLVLHVWGKCPKPLGPISSSWRISDEVINAIDLLHLFSTEKIHKLPCGTSS